MTSDFYTQGFLEKLAAYEKCADLDAVINASKELDKRRDAANGIEKPEEYTRPKSFGESLRRSYDRLGTNLRSLGIGLSTGVLNLGLRAGQGVLDFHTMIPRLADSLILGKLVGVDEGRGLLGRAWGNFNRFIDKQVDVNRRISSDYDEKHRVGGKFNRFINGIASDAAGSFIGWQGFKKGLLNKGFGLWGAYGTLSPTSANGQLRQREAWIRSLDPRDRLRVDPTSTAENQENAPTAQEYQRYHLPSYNLPTSSTGYIRVPYWWSHQSNDKPVNFRDFGT